MDVAVVGAGIGGLALARALQMADVPCHVLERPERRTDTAGGIQLSPNAVRPARRLGLGPALAEHGVAIEAIEYRTWRGHPVAATPLGARCEELFGAPYYTVHRADLHACLGALLDPDVIRAGPPVVGVDQDARGVVVVREDGTRHGADAVVGADGLHSVVRGHLVDDAPVSRDLTALRALVPASELPPGAASPRVRVWFGPGAHVVCYPVSGGRLLSITAVLDGAGVDDEPGEVFADWHAPVALLTRIAPVVHRSVLYDREPLGRWTRGRVTVLGDAAHPMLPFLAQGAGQAVEDAVELADHLTDAPARAVPGRLRRYAAGRAGRTEAVARAARDQARYSHLPDGADQRARDEALRRGAGLAGRDWLYGDPRRPRAATA